MAITDTAPYGTVEGITAVMETYRETGFGGAPITVELVTRMSMGGEVARRVVLSLKLLELIDDDGMPTVNFVAFKQAPSADYKQLFANLLYDIYGPIFAVLGKDLASKTTTQIEDAFRSFKQDSLRPRMVRCFLGLCEYAGITQGSTRAPKIPENRRTVKLARRNGPPPPPPPPSLETPTTGAMRRTVKLRSGGEVTMIVTVDFFALDERDHQFVMDLINKMKSYVGQRALPPAPIVDFGGQPLGSKPEDPQTVGGGA